MRPPGVAVPPVAAVRPRPARPGRPRGRPPSSPRSVIASANRSIIGRALPDWWALIASKYDPVSFRSPADIGAVVFFTSPLERSKACTTARPVRPLPVREGVDRLELGVGDGRLNYDRDVVTTHESHQVVDRSRNQRSLRRYVRSAARAYATKSDPHQRLAEAAGVALPAAPAEQMRLHGTDRVGIKTVCELQCRLHRPDVRDDDPGVVGVGLVDHCKSKLTCTHGQVLDLRRRGRLGAQQDG